LSLEVITLPASSGHPAEWVMVLLHGWGANAADLASLVPFLQLPNYTFLCPQAPHPHPHVQGGWMWYDLSSLIGFQSSVDSSSGSPAEPMGLPESRQLLQAWLLTLPQRTGVPLERTVLAGFSQGGAMTLDLGLTLPVAALMVYSGFLHSNPQQASHKPPVFMAHGLQDPVVPLAAAQMAYRQLSKAGIAVTYQEYPMGHEISPAVLQSSHMFLANLAG
jgi:phospholipase/carboxylesterase